MRSRVFAVFLLVLTLSSSVYARHRSAPSSDEVEGVIKSITSAQLVVTDEHKHDVTLNITPDTIFRSGDMAIAPSDLKVGDRVEVKAVQTSTALNALVVKLQKKEQEKPQLLELSGVIKSVSATELVVTDAKQHDTTVEITKDTVIRRGDQPATASDLAKGDRVEIKAVQSGTQVNAVLIKVEQSDQQEPQFLELSGVIKSVSATELVVTGKDGKDTTLQITPDTVIRKNDKPATVSDLANGDRVEVKAVVSGTTTTAVLINDETDSETDS